MAWTTGVTTGATMAAEFNAAETKLAGIAAGATANSADAALRARADHTGTQPASTISDFAEATDDRVAALLQQGANFTITYNDAANTLTLAASYAVADITNPGLAAAPEAGPDRFYAFHDCVNATNSEDIIFSVAGTGAAHSNQIAQDGGYGWQRGALGTTATGRAAIVSSNFTTMRLGLGRAICTARARVLTLSTGTDTFSLRSGFLDSNTAESTDGAFFRYTDSVNGGKWQAVTRSNGVETAVDTGITVAINTTYKMQVDANAAGTSVEFRINGTLVATITTNIPNASGRESGYGFAAIRTVGTAAVNAYDVDYLMAEQRFTGR